METKYILQSISKEYKKFQITYPMASWAIELQNKAGRKHPPLALIGLNVNIKSEAQQKKLKQSEVLIKT